MNASIKDAIGTAASETATTALGLLPHLGPLAAAIGPFGLDPRVRQLVAIAVARGHGCVPCAAVHSAIGHLAGLTEAERHGDYRGLTAAERAAVGLGLGTVSRFDPDLDAPPADEHFSSGEIEQLRAVALAVDLACAVHDLPGRLVSAAVSPGPPREEHGPS